jgi:hypothetical protein
MPERCSVLVAPILERLLVSDVVGIEAKRLCSRQQRVLLRLRHCRRAREDVNAVLGTKQALLAVVLDAVVRACDATEGCTHSLAKPM